MNDYRTPITISVKSSTKTALQERREQEEIAKRRRISISEVVETILLESFAAHNDINHQTARK